jgi:uncharacterized protein
MMPDWSHSVDVDRLADARASHDFAYPLSELPRLREQLLELQGAATGHVEFRRERGLPIASLQVSATLALQCQRCLQSVTLPVRGSVQVALVDDLAAADAVPEGTESVLINSGRALLRDLVEEELLLGLPLVPRHADTHCAEPGFLGSTAAADDAATDEPLPPETTQTPFAELGELLKRR